MRALIAFDKFKDALTAQEACAIARDTLQASSADCVVDLCPLTDGGEGFVDVLTAALNGRFVTVPVTGPRGGKLTASVGLVRLAALPAEAVELLALPGVNARDTPDSLLAVIAMSSASGLALLPPAERDPWQTSSMGTGELLRAAADIDGGTGAPPVSRKDPTDLHSQEPLAGSALHVRGRAHISAILLGIGGSATNDLGLGALAALGLQFLDTGGHVVSPVVPAEWARVSQIAGRIAPLPPIRIACDVTNPLAGSNGATAVYGPQKGLRAEDVDRLEGEVLRFAAMLQQHCQAPADFSNMPGAGAAGGIAFGLATALDARLVNGFELFRAWCDLDARLQAADVVITGEGRFDATSLQGKGPGAVAERARKLGKPVHVFAGQVQTKPIHAISLHEITPAGLPLHVALRTTRENLAAAVRAAFSCSNG